MCELFALSSRLPATVDMSLEAFSRHGGLTGPHKDGWGIAYYEGFDLRLIRDTDSAADSDWVRFLGHHPIYSTVVISHIRRQTVGEVSLRNTQPYARELGGRMHAFAHNGHLGKIEDHAGLRLGRYRPIGNTDSEYAFCALLARLEPLWLGSSGEPGMAARVEALAAFANELRALGPANFIYSDGALLVAHGHRRTQAEGIIEPPGLWTLERHCPMEDRRFETQGLTVVPESQQVVLVASVPLTAEPWRPLAEGELLVVQDAARLELRGVPPS